MQRFEEIATTRGHIIALGVGLLCLLVGVLFDGKSENLFLNLSASFIAAYVLFQIFRYRENLLERVRECGIVDLFSSRIAKFPGEDPRLLMLKKAKDHFRLLGAANSSFLGGFQNDYERLIREKSASARIEITWLSPFSAIASYREVEEQKSGVKEIVDAITWAWTLRNSLPIPNQGNFILKVYDDAVPTFNICWIDEVMLVTLLIPAEKDFQSPGFVLQDSRATEKISQINTSSHATMFERYAHNYHFLTGKPKANVIDEKFMARLPSLSSQT